MTETQESKLTWKQDMAFAAELQGHQFMVDASSEHGGKDLGPRPKTLVLTALAGCTGMDVVAILKKMRVTFAAFEVKVSGELTENHPKVYDKIHVIYHLKGENIDRTKVERAVELSRTTYCGVFAMLAHTAKVTHDIIIDT
ncbi:MAG: OsmC family protein [Deltaproteobacteria bacterium]|nr:OsmC family protein [Deltaproteobacteria bacterium]